MAGVLLLAGVPSVATVLLYGQSNMNSFARLGTGSPPAALAGVSLYDAGAPADTPNPNVWATPTADGIVNLLNGLTTLTGQPWRAVNGAVNGTGSGYLSDPAPAGGLGIFLASIAAAGVTSANLIFWRQGEDETGASGAPPLTQREYYANIARIHQHLAAAMGKTTATLPFIISSLATGVGTRSGEVATSLMWANVQRYLFEAEGSQPGMYFSHSNIDSTMNADGLHQTGPGNAQSGVRYLQTAKSILGYGGGAAHFEITSATTINATTTRATINHSSGATDWSGSTGFEVSGDNGATWSAATVTRVDASTFDLVTAGSKSTTNARRFRYQWGEAPSITSLIVDNSPLVLPLTYTRRDVVPTALSTVPVPYYWDRAYDNTQSSFVQVNAGLSIGPAAARRLVIVGFGGAWTVATVKIKPNVGTEKTATVKQGLQTDVTQARIAWAVLDADADTATTVTVTIDCGVVNPFATTQLDVWAIPSAALNSTTPVDSIVLGQQPVASSKTINLATSAGGFVIAYAFNDTNLLGTLTGTESYATRYAPNLFLRTIAADSCNNATNASSAVTVTYPAATGKISMCAVSWR